MHTRPSRGLSLSRGGHRGVRAASDSPVSDWSIEGEMMVEGKGFDQQPPKDPNDLGQSTAHDPASEGTSRPPASHPEGGSVLVGDGSILGRTRPVENVAAARSSETGCSVRLRGPGCRGPLRTSWTDLLLSSPRTPFAQRATRVRIPKGI